MEKFDKSLYKVKRLFKDEHFENGFTVYPLTHDDDRSIPGVDRQFPKSSEKPSWRLIQHYSKHCLVDNPKDTGNPYEITDMADSKMVRYNPDEKSLLMKLDARKVYEGKSKNYKFWPHLLIEQKHICDYKNMPEGEEKRFYSADADKICVEFDIRLTEYIPTTNPEDLNVCQFVGYVYLQLVDANHIYFGFGPFDNRGPMDLLWKQETGGSNFIYGLPAEIVMGGKDNMFCATPYDVKVSDEWKHVEVDLTPHIDFIMESANRDLVFGRPVKRSEFYFSGTNVGFETHGNISCTFEIKNYNLVSYIKK